MQLSICNFLFLDCLPNQDKNPQYLLFTKGKDRFMPYQGHHLELKYNIVKHLNSDFQIHFHMSLNDMLIFS